MDLSKKVFKTFGPSRKAPVLKGDQIWKIKADSLEVEADRTISIMLLEVSSC